MEPAQPGQPQDRSTTRPAFHRIRIGSHNRTISTGIANQDQFNNRMNVHIHH